MKLTIQQVYDARETLVAIINEKRALPQKGGYRIARMFEKLNVEFGPISAKRDEMLRDHATAITEGPDAGRFNITPAFLDAWNDFAKDPIDVEVEPIPLAHLSFGDDTVGSIAAHELIALGELVKE